jgi:hypothetical protein
VGDRNANVIPLAEAATVLRLAPDAVVGLVDGGYLSFDAAGTANPDGPGFRLADLKAFVARNSGTDEDLFTFERGLDKLEQVDPRDLLDALDGRAPEMARQVYDIFSTVFPEARGWESASRPGSSIRPGPGSRPSWPSPARAPRSTKP